MGNYIAAAVQLILATLLFWASDDSDTSSTVIACMLIVCAKIDIMNAKK